MWHFWKSFTSYLHNRTTLKHNSNWFWKLQCNATIFPFFLLFLEIGHVTTLPTTHCRDPDRYDHSYLVFFTFWSKQVIFPFWSICTGPWHGPWKQCPIIHQLYVPSIFFLPFLDISSSETSKLPFLDMYPGPWKYPLKYWPPFLFFDLFYSHFSLRNAKIFIFENAH